MMKTKYFIFAFLFFVLCIFPAVKAQEWISLDSGTDQKLTSVYFKDDSVGWAVGGAGIGIEGAYPIIIKTTNGGDEWTEQSVPASVDNNVVLHDVCFASPSVGWAVGTSTILKTTNGGETWIRQDYPVNTVPIIYGVACIDEESAVVVGTPGSRYGTEYGNILKTENGETWTVVYSGRAQFADVYFKDDSVGWAVGDEGVIIKTTNGGDSWLSSQTVASGQSALTCNGDECWSVGWLDEIYKTTDDETWVAVDTTETGLFTGMAWLTPTFAVMTAQSSLLESADSGVMWEFASTDISTGTGLLDINVWMREVVCESGICWAVGDEGTILRRGTVGEEVPEEVPEEEPEETETPDEEETSEEGPKDFDQPEDCPAFFDDCEAGYNPVPEYGSNGCIVDYTCVRGKVSLEDVRNFIGRVPGLGVNERINIYINNNDGSQQVWGVVIENKEVVEVEPSELDSPTIRVDVTEEVVERILESDNPAGVALSAIKAKEISIKAYTFGGKIKLAFAKLFVFFKK